MLILPESWNKFKTDLKEEVDGFQIVTLTPTSSLLHAPPPFPAVPAPPPLVFSLAFQDGCRDQCTSEFLSKIRLLCRLPINLNISFVFREFCLSSMQYKETLIFLWQEQARRTSAWTRPSFSSYNDRAPGENVHYVINALQPIWTMGYLKVYFRNQL